MKIIIGEGELLFQQGFPFLGDKSVSIILLDKVLENSRSKYKNKQLKRFNDLIDYILRTNGELHSIDEKLDFKEVDKVSGISLSPLELELIKYCASTSLDNNNDDFLLLTNSSNLILAAKSLSIKAEKAIFTNLNEPWLIGHEIKDTIAKLRNTARQNIVALIIAALGSYAQNTYNSNPKSFSYFLEKCDLVYVSHYKLFWFVLIPFIGLLLYLLRCKALLVYAVIEILVGVSLAGTTASSMSRDQAHDIVIILKILTSIYIIVRGLDNMGKHFRKSGSDNFWDKFFKES